MRIRSAFETVVKPTLWEAEWAAWALLFAALTGMGAIMRVPLSPVPLTMQVFFVLLSSIVLGPVWGPLSQLAYLAMGLCGAPFFAAPPHAGPAVLFGPTGGYLWGFVLASAVTGWLSAAVRRRARGRRSAANAYLLLSGLAGVVAIYAAGTGWLAAWLGALGKDSSLAFALGVRPFIAPDLAKAALAALAAGSVIPLAPGTGKRAMK